LKLNNTATSVGPSPCFSGQGDFPYTELTSMPTRVLEIFNIELSSWLRSLDFMEQENAFLKNNLSRILDTFNEEGLINWADEYQGIILQREAVMDLLKEDILKQEALIATTRYNHHSFVNNRVASLQKEIRSKIEYVEKEFQLLKVSFIHDFERITNI
jgi:hypothetical protein